MTTWTLEKAKNGFSEVVRRALNHQPQLVTRGRGGEDAVVVIARSDYEKLVSPGNLADFLRASVLADAVRDGLFDDDSDAFPRSRDSGRSIDFD